MTTEKQLTFYQKNLLDQRKTLNNWRLAKKKEQCLMKLYAS